MIKVYLFINAVAGLDLAPDAESALRAACPKVNAALLSVALPDAIPGRPPSTSGVLELWFESAADICEVPLASVIDGSAEVVHELAGIERTVMRAPEFYSTQGVKGIYAFRRQSGMSVDDFQHYWWHNHGPIAALTENATCYLQTHVLKSAYDNGDPAFDGVTELYWPDLPSALAALGSRQMTEDQANDAENFVELGSVDLMMATQQIIIPPWKEV